jgi:hypothetical protein
MESSVFPFQTDLTYSSYDFRDKERFKGISTPTTLSKEDFIRNTKKTNNPNWLR